MSGTTKIEWADATINFWWGCQKVSPACEHCYAEALDARFHPEHEMDGSRVAKHWGIDAPRLLRVEAATKEAFTLQRRAVKEGRRIRVFTNSMSDFFEDRRDLDAARLEALEVIRQTPDLTWMILTKRPEKIWPWLLRACEIACPSAATWFWDWFNGAPPTNVWIGTTVENQEWADKRIPELLEVPAAVRFLSVEPMLGPVDLEGLNVQVIHPDNEGYGIPATKALDWVICGGESGPKARPMHPSWPLWLKDQCGAAGVPFFFKQWGEYEDTGRHGPRAGDVAIWPDGEVRTLCGGENPASRAAAIMRRVGKAAAGRLLDGVEHSAFPGVS